MIYALGNARSIYFIDEGRVLISYAMPEFLEQVHYPAAQLADGEQKIANSFAPWCASIKR